MSEEKPVFKVRDRRLFNPDGTPREVEREEDERPASEAASPPAAATDSPAASASASQASAPPAAASASPASGAEQAGEAGRSAGGASVRESQAVAGDPEDEAEAGEVPGADDPASFINFLMSIASNAAAALGMMEHPATGQRGVDLPLGKHWIDVLGMLQQKTQGNLHPQEQQILEGILSDLRMQYVSLSSARPARPAGGFSGRDIIGGK